MKGLDKLKRWLFTPQSKFKVGDTVQLIGGDGQLMVVVEICSDPEMEGALISCQWYDPKCGSRRNFFREQSLESFDWYHVHAQIRADNARLRAK